MRLNAAGRILAAGAMILAAWAGIGALWGCDGSRGGNNTKESATAATGTRGQAPTNATEPTAALPDCAASTEELGNWPAEWSLETYNYGGGDPFIDCVANRKPSLRHDDNAGAIAHVVGAARANKILALLGHGGPGRICTGWGTRCVSMPALQLSSWNENGPAGWGRLIPSPPPAAGGLMFLSCSTGAEEEGADFLSGMAKRLGCPVRAWTYLVWCKGGEILLDKKGKWQVAEVGKRPAAIPAPDDSVGASDLEVEVVRITYTFEGQQPVTFTPVAADGQNLAPRIGISAPCRTSAYPAAFERGSLEVRTRPLSRPGEPWATRILRILGDQLLQDAGRPDVYYYVKRDFGGVLRNLVSRYAERRSVTPASLTTR